MREPRHLAGDPHVLPDNGIRHRLTRLSVPHDCGFALIGDSDRGQVTRFQLCLRHGFGDYRLSSLPDFFRIVLHPTRLRINLAVLLLRAGHHLARVVKNNEARAGGPLIDGADVVAQNWVLNSRRILSETSITNFGQFWHSWQFWQSSDELLYLQSRTNHLLSRKLNLLRSPWTNPRHLPTTPNTIRHFIFS